MSSPPPDRRIACRSLRGGTRYYPASEVRFRAAAYGIAVRSGLVLLGKSAFTGLLDIPGGAVEPWETLEEGLRREFMEETGVVPEPLRLFHVDESFIAFFDRPFHSLRFYYLVSVPGDAAFRPDPGEITDLAWIDVAVQPEEAFAPGDRELLLRAVAAAQDR